MKFLSLFSGIEAASVVWHPLGWECVGVSEIEPFPCSVLAQHYPDVPNLGDITAYDFTFRACELLPDVVVGGSPCQAFSLAGLRKSLSDHRGNLALRYIQVVEEIDDARIESGLAPVIIVYENVPGILNTSDNAFGCFIAALSGHDEELHPPTKRGGVRVKWPDAGCVIGPTRTVAWRVLDAQYFGVAQRRRRVFVVASARTDIHPAQVLFEFDGVRRDTAPSRETGQEVTGTLSSRTSAGGGLGTDFECAGGLQPVAFNTTQITSPANRNNPKYGDPCHTLASQDHAPVICMAHGQGGAEISVGRSPTLTCNHEAPIAFTAMPHTAYGFQPRIGRNGRGDMGEVVSALTAQAGETGKGDAAPCVAYAMNATVIGRQAHNGPSGKGWYEDSSPTLTKSDVHAVAFQSSQSGVRVDSVHATLDANNGSRRHNGTVSGTQVRRLTPTECERLQGFPDNYSQVLHRNKPAADGPRYKALGNSMAVPVMQWIGKRIEFALNNPWSDDL